MQVTPGGLTADQAGARAAQTSWRPRPRWRAAQRRRARRRRVGRLSAAPVGHRQVHAPERLHAPVDRLRTTGPEPRVHAGARRGHRPAPVPQLQRGTRRRSVFPFFVLDNWLFQGTITVPISDYFLRIDQNYNAATHSEEAARWDVITARAASEANGRLAYYTWLDARGAVIVAVEALNDQKTHLRDARNQFAAGNASKADVLRAETASASAELQRRARQEPGRPGREAAAHGDALRRRASRSCRARTSTPRCRPCRATCRR